MFIEFGYGETFILKNGQTLTGELLELKDNQYTIKIGNEKKRISKEEVISITDDHALSTQTSTGKYGSPQSTFETWRNAAIDGNIKAMVSCYVSYQQKRMKKKLKKISRKKRKEMSEVTRQTDFSLTEPLFQGDRATMQVTWRMGLQTDVQPLQFALEDGKWKLIDS
ncbi:MAG: hypothetical protein KDD48_08830 [Bdellovibrionales bacterium]|nr:hypothetical protein [Bdellovibrionales bacterium]